MSFRHPLEHLESSAFSPLFATSWEDTETQQLPAETDTHTFWRAQEEGTTPTPGQEIGFSSLCDITRGSTVIFTTYLHISLKWSKRHKLRVDFLTSGELINRMKSLSVIISGKTGKVRMDMQYCIIWSHSVIFPMMQWQFASLSCSGTYAISCNRWEENEENIA